MAVTYSAEQRKRANEGGLHLVTIAAGGIEFQGPTTEEERDRLARYLLDFLDRRRAEHAKPKAVAQPQPSANGAH